MVRCGVCRHNQTSHSWCIFLFVLHEFQLGHGSSSNFSHSWKIVFSWKTGEFIDPKQFADWLEIFSTKKSAMENSTKMEICLFRTLFQTFDIN
jgi:hypothetical protein